MTDARSMLLACESPKRKTTATQQAYRDAMNQRARMTAEATRAAKAAAPKSSWWVGVSDQEFTERHRERVVEMSAVTVSYVKPWGVV